MARQLADVLKKMIAVIPPEFPGAATKREHWDNEERAYYRKALTSHLAAITYSAPEGQSQLWREVDRAFNGRLAADYEDLLHWQKQMVDIWMDKERPHD